ncbi:DUF4126 domain-containing protein [Reyranella sp.]|jgi:hypothetical protein|uniref:DUF4126 domain-containing protein n=1 Tax=Reyranella sp. TaxID=1929291 RepID=UPI000BCC31F7|nr:DUF4126 domain-containing protein [Reyranella sp.]OYY41052.1 MAG: hypothetical protein B7Y57_15980 [Rhodospirillales bacterium 35-66-84]OYZ96023.1 MAG: hypothetical protein B7Y08_06245 [Rhodospirillales bacterium 24-66-33]OZB25903.1 MAG: hypothetical protein B7X63_11150 [Rhodospirillales bacterium 39-66-50]HQS14838.1 DUF4126 domain-containing protein [Reyranella sp.]HQT14225.1 DUF4126 domain-containing protein [Reyranella sp.]
MSAETLTAIAVALGAGWASGLNAYAAVLVLGVAQRLGLVALPHDLQVLESPWVLGVAAILFALNFLADKIPYVDSINDVLQTFVRIPAGVLLAYGAATGLSPEFSIIAGLLGGTLAAGTHIAKTGSRALINTSPEPFTNVFASLGEDVTVLGGLALAIAYPITFLCLLALFVVLLIWLLPKLVRLALVPFRRLARGRQQP